MNRRSRSRGTWPLALVLGLGVAGSPLASSSARGAGLVELVQANGLSPVDPPRPAADFSLPRRGGGEASLSSFQGTWVVLTFWASWCGPCRAEMPSLERLHQQLGAGGVTVLGVSVDDDRAAADAFADQLGLSFPLLWDEMDRVGRQYQATAIPMSYLVDPHGQIVALARGARDWTQVAPLMEALLTEMPVQTDVHPVYADTLELPTVLEPPTAEMELSNEAPRVGQEFFLDIHLRWAGHFEEYLPQPPKVHLPEGMLQQGVTASTSSRKGSQVVLYRVTLRADEPGSYALDPVELRYTPRLATSDAAARFAGPTVEVRPRTLAGLSPRNLALGLGGLGLSFVVGFLVSRHRRAGKAQSSDPVGLGYESVSERYKRARALRMQGDGAAFALAMLELRRELSDIDARETHQLAELEEALRYGGRVPSADELDRLQRTVERRLEALRPDPDAATRSALQLQDREGEIGTRMEETR